MHFYDQLLSYISAIESKSHLKNGNKNHGLFNWWDLKLDNGGHLKEASGRSQIAWSIDVGMLYVDASMFWKFWHLQVPGMPLIPLTWDCSMNLFSLGLNTHLRWSYYLLLSVRNISPFRCWIDDQIISPLTRLLSCLKIEEYLVVDQSD